MDEKEYPPSFEGVWFGAGIALCLLGPFAAFSLYRRVLAVPVETYDV